MVATKWLLAAVTGTLAVALAGCGSGTPDASAGRSVAPVADTTSATSATSTAAPASSAAPAGSAAPTGAATGIQQGASAEPAAPAEVAVSPVPEAAPCGPRVRACVRLSTKQAWLLTDGRIDYGPVPMMYGRPGHETPVGSFWVSWKDREHTSNIYGLPMPYSVFFASGGIAFHEGSLTEPSHGCVHLAADAAARFFDSLRPGDAVQVLA
ncbi:L,D-transpeptidase [Goodfellowiella coeruleoviolacea]|uniref:Lipoprotein-anchoring transpeptidase ErfK/SrfK n=1 Tax=Goodfellowiella coeruleoviolacea TaxID=334858 RepID=A0AAE3GEF4_9PSEU|nr:L,D-transpeptidase [Goodfellowiella coeruleoviolacea]MCP2164623.1 Lipoprotein-anchoring transpeptidase ErfK/SrfK [Goodfellowiella coeruleoviolacea]